jgi:hypothetical protein
MMAKYVTGTREEWLAARLELLKAEKEYSRQGDEQTRAVWIPSLACTTGSIVPPRDATRRASGGVGTMSTTTSRETSLTHDANASTNLTFDSADKN